MERLAWIRRPRSREGHIARAALATPTLAWWVMADNAFLSSAAYRAHCAEIVRALDAAQARRNFDSGEPRAAVEACARAARAAGVLPEKLIVELKSLMRDVALPEMRTWYRSVMTDRVIVWAIEAFYGIDDATENTERAEDGPR